MSLESVMPIQHKNIRRHKSVTSNAQRINALEEVINGNGAIGLKGKVVQLDTKYDGIKDDVSEIKEGQKWALRLAVTQALGFVVAIVLYLLNR